MKYPKKLPVILMVILFLFANFQCSTTKKEEKKTEAMPATFPEKAKNMVIYEVNIRQYTPEGTIRAFMDHLPRLKELGVDILWLMPVQPIGMENRKGSLGSYYSIRDYTSVNPEFGTINDLIALVNQAHTMGLYVILDWVANHTAFDHPWIKQDGYYNTDTLGNILSPVADWSDVADLNYENDQMKQEMIQSMLFWIRQADVDGFRCDMAGMVPNAFWNMAMDSLFREKEDLLLLAEWEEPHIHDNFHISYSWKSHHVMNDIVSGKKTAADLREVLKEDKVKFANNYRMLFITNHDENSWNGTIEERLGDGHKAFALLTFTLDGLPLIYSGQEAGNNKRLAFFDKDTIQWNEWKLQDFYKSLIELKKGNPALWAGEYGGSVNFIVTDDPDILAFNRQKDNNSVLVVANLSDKSKSLSLNMDLPEFSGYFNEDKINPKSIELPPYGYLVGINNISNE